MKPILEIKEISKKYKINHEGKQSYLSIRDSISSIFKKTNRRKEEFWALEKVSFDVYPGESIGIIGKNGAGKSTLLKILSKIIPPTEGRIIARGRIASLLEVGTGFHPELTGRENIYLNGSILGMKHVEVEKNLEAIVDFSGVYKFLDTPLKHYSSGMQLRLAFAVAAFLEPEILIIDEVLAVGDAEFQKKCIGKMNEVSKSGKTVIFVSHNMGMMQQLCGKVALLKQGQLIVYGPAEKVIKSYLQMEQESVGIRDRVNESKKQYINSLQLSDQSNITQGVFGHKEPILLKAVCVVKEYLNNTRFSILVLDAYHRVIFTSEKEIPQNCDEVVYEIKIPGEFLTPGNYSIQPAIHIPNFEIIDFIEEGINFEIIDEGSALSVYAGSDIGCVYANCEWNIISKNKGSIIE